MYNIYIFNCTQCNSELRVQGSFIPKHSGLCVKCAQFGLPFISCYNVLLKSSKNRNISLLISYNEFLTFTKINCCHYCNAKILWIKHTRHNNIPNKEGRSYKLDRKDSNGPYSLNNCVVCCFRCNASKSNRYSYEE